MEIDVGGKIPLTLPDDIYGILGLRTWNVKGNSEYLHSLMMSHEWTGAIQKSAKPTTLPGQHGFYAYRLTPQLDVSEFYSTLSTSRLFPNARIQVHGLVELRGRVIEHADGVIRGEWCRILCFFLPVPSLPDYPDRPIHDSSSGVFSFVDMKIQISESRWLQSILERYRVPVYLTDTSRLVVIFERLIEFDKGRANQPAPVEYKETRPEILKKVDELVEQAFQRGYFMGRIYLSRQQMKEFKEAISAPVEPIDSPVVYKRVLITIGYSEDRTPYLTVRDKMVG